MGLDPWKQTNKVVTPFFTQRGVRLIPTWRKRLNPRRTGYVRHWYFAQSSCVSGPMTWRDAAAARCAFESWCDPRCQRRGCLRRVARCPRAAPHLPPGALPRLKRPSPRKQRVCRPGLQQGKVLVGQFNRVDPYKDRDRNASGDAPTLLIEPGSLSPPRTFATAHNAGGRRTRAFMRFSPLP
jgi:hypothetical protein